MSPTTRAGRDYLAGTLIGKDGVGRAIAAIEAEARQQERERLAALVEALPPCLIHSTADDAYPDPHLHRAAVLSILRGEDS